ncbi:MAG: hypothetical protein ACLQPD_33050 [Desulfomonilaceae bacterium]
MLLKSAQTLTFCCEAPWIENYQTGLDDLTGPQNFPRKTIVLAGTLFEYEVNLVHRESPGHCTVATPARLIDGIERLFFISNRKAVLAFLYRFPFLVNILFLAFAVAQDHFKEATFSLELRTDPEIRNRERIMLYINTNLDVEKALQRLRKIDRTEDWRKLSKGLLILDVEFHGF